MENAGAVLNFPELPPFGSDSTDLTQTCPGFSSGHHRLERHRKLNGP